jgi:protein subunit release factor B
VQEDPWFAPDGYDVETSWDLGSDRDASQADLRDFVSMFLHQTKRWCESYNTPTAFTFVLTGSEESLRDGKVQLAIREAVLTCNHSTIVEFTSSHNYVTARGAAKMATLPTNDMPEKARNFQLYR